MIYLDYAASTPLHPLLREVLPKMLAMTGNHQSDQMQDLKKLIESAKEDVAEYIQADPERIFFTSGATESINLALMGAARFYKRNGEHIITFASEHSAVLQATQALEEEGFEVSVLPILANGTVDITEFEAALTPNTILVSINLVCNETGCFQDLRPFLALREKYGFMLHVDGSQMVGKVPFSVHNMPVDFLTLSSHKCYGPQGVGALYIAKGRHVQPLIHGANPVRAGTMPHGLIIGMGQAYKYALSDFSENIEHIVALRQQFIDGLRMPYQIMMSEESVPHILNISFPDADVDAIKKVREKIYCQISSACFSGGVSHVLQARGMKFPLLQRSIRFSFGILTTKEEIYGALEILNNDLQAL